MVSSKDTGNVFSVRGPEVGLLVELGDLGDFLGSEAESGDLEVGFLVDLGGSLGNDDDTSAEVPVENDLSGGLLVLLGKLNDNGLLGGVVGGAAILGVESAGGGPGNGLDAVLLHEADELGLGAVGEELDLVAHGLNLGVGEDVLHELHIEVGKTDGLDLSLLDESFEAGVEHVHGTGLAGVVGW